MAQYLEQPETVHPQVSPLVTGHFQEKAGYTTWRRNGTHDWLLICTLNGHGRFGFDGGERQASRGDLTLIRPGTRHDYGVGAGAEQWDLIWTHFHPEQSWQPWLHWPEAAPGLMTLTLADPAALDKVVGRLFDMHLLATGALRHREIFAMNALEEVLLWCDTWNPRSDQASLDPRVLAAMDFLCRSLDAPMTLEALATRIGLSPSRLSHLFRQQSGRTPLQFLEQQRLERACQLLDVTTRPIAAIAAEVGFENPFYFTLRFKRHTGYSPREYRNRGGAR